MIKRGQVLVRAIKKDGNEGTVDVLDLDGESFRAFILAVLVDCHAVGSMNPEILGGEPLKLKEKI